MAFLSQQTLDKLFLRNNLLGFSIGVEELMGRIESPETDQNILENLTKSGQSGLYDKWY